MTTKHTCGGPVFGRKTPGCPRCDELIAGVPPVIWSAKRKAEQTAQRIAEIRAHDCRQARCSSVCCTYGEF